MPISLKLKYNLIKITNDKKLVLNKIYLNVTTLTSLTGLYMRYLYTFIYTLRVYTEI